MSPCSLLSRMTRTAQAQASAPSTQQRDDHPDHKHPLGIHLAHPKNTAHLRAIEPTDQNPKGLAQLPRVLVVWRHSSQPAAALPCPSAQAPPTDPWAMKLHRSCSLRLQLFSESQVHRHNTQELESPALNTSTGVDAHSLKQRSWGAGPTLSSARIHLDFSKCWLTQPC